MAKFGKFELNEQHDYGVGAKLLSKRIGFTHGDLQWIAFQ
jgi:hypothetical protein